MQRALCWLPMKKCFGSYALCTWNEIIIEKCPPYLYKKLRYRINIHNLNIRHSNLLSCPQHRTRILQIIFLYNVVKFYNAVPNEFKKLKLVRFKKEIKAHLLQSLYIFDCFRDTFCVYTICFFVNFASCIILCWTFSCLSLKCLFRIVIISWERSSTWWISPCCLNWGNKDVIIITFCLILAEMSRPRVRRIYGR